MRLRDYVWRFGWMNSYNENVILIPKLMKRIPFNELYESLFEDESIFEDIEIDEVFFRTSEFMNFRRILNEVWGKPREVFDDYIYGIFNNTADYARFDSDDEDYFINWLLEIKDDLEDNRKEYDFNLWITLKRIINELAETELKTKKLNKEIFQYNDLIIKSTLLPMDYYWNKIIVGYDDVKSSKSFHEFLDVEIKNNTDSNKKFLKRVNQIVSILENKMHQGIIEFNYMKSFKIPHVFKITNFNINYTDIEILTHKNFLIEVNYKDAQIHFTLELLTQIISDHKEFRDGYINKDSLPGKAKLTSSSKKILNVKPNLLRSNEIESSITILGEEAKTIIFESLKNYVENVNCLQSLIFLGSQIDDKIDFRGSKVAIADFFKNSKKVNLISGDDTKISRWIIKNFKAKGEDLKFSTTHDVLRGKHDVMNGKINILTF